MIFELPEAILGQTHGLLVEVMDGTDLTRNDPHIRLTIRLGTGADWPDGIQPIRRWIRSEELVRFREARAEKGWSTEDWRKQDLIDWITEYGVRGGERVTPDEILPVTPGSEPAASSEPTTEVEAEPEPVPPKKTLWQKLNSPIGDVIRGN